MDAAAMQRIMLQQRVTQPQTSRMPRLDPPPGAAIKNPPPDVGDTRRLRFDPWVRKTPWRRKWQPTLVFLPGKSHGQRNLVVYGVAKSQTRLRD